MSQRTVRGDGITIWRNKKKNRYGSYRSHGMPRIINHSDTHLSMCFNSQYFPTAISDTPEETIEYKHHLYYPYYFFLNHNGETEFYEEQKFEITEALKLLKKYKINSSYMGRNL